MVDNTIPLAEAKKLASYTIGLDLPAVSLKELMGLELPEPVRLLPWPKEGGLAMIYGPRGLGKTYFALGMAMSLITGQTFIRWAVEKPVGVLIVDGEMQLSDLRERIVKMLSQEPAARLEIVSHEVAFDRTKRDLDFGTEDWQATMKAYLDENPDIRVVIFDNLSCLFASVPEDKRDDWVERVRPFFTWLRHRGIAAVLIHHAGKGGDQRGTSAREDILDTVIKLGWLSDHDATLGARFRVQFSKSRGCYGDDVADIEAYLDEDHTGLPSWSWKDIEESNETRLLNLVRDGIDNVRDAAAELDVTAGYVSKMKKKLTSKGLLKAGRTLEVIDD
jgi:putative DNA primase/helicase